MKMTKVMRNAWRGWAGDYFSGWLRLWAIEAAFKAGWMLSRGEEVTSVRHRQDPAARA